MFFKPPLNKIHNFFLCYKNPLQLSCWHFTVFANSFYEICEKYNADYSIIKEAMTNRNFISNEYLECNEKWRGYAGPCWTKDLPALNKIAEGTGVEFFKHIIEENEKYIKTVPGGMRMK